MFWRSVVGKVWFTILLLVFFVLFVLSVLLIEFFENFHITKAEEDLMQTAVKVSDMVEQYQDRSLIMETTSRIKDPSSKVAVQFDNGDLWISDSDDNSLPDVTKEWIANHRAFAAVDRDGKKAQAQTTMEGSENNVIIVGAPLQYGEGAVFVYQSLGVLEETTRQTTKIIFLGAGVAFILTTVFAFFLSTRITAPLIKMREGAAELARGEFNTKIPILTHDEIGDLAIAFNHMGRELKFHINALRQEKEQVSSILSSMADGVITLNRRGEIIVSNPPAEKFLGDWKYENEENQAREGSGLPAELKDFLAEVVSSENEVMRELQIQGRNWVMIMTPLYDQSYVRGAVAVFRDMTEERRMDKLREDFIANVSHELRTPISMLQGYSEAIVDDVAVTREEKNELAGIIHDESMRIGRLVNELLDLARMESGHIQLRMEQVHAKPFVEKIIKKFHGMANEKNIELQLEDNLKDDIFLLDADRIEQVFTNLIDNAITHSFPKGRVVVTIEQINDSFSVLIRDSGSGIPQEDLPFIFERFYKADKSRKREKGRQGTGLGLAIAKNIIESHQGSITVQSKQGEGTTFSFQIPKSRVG